MENKSQKKNNRETADSIDQAVYEEEIIFIHTPKCKDCWPTPEKIKRRSCAGCTKYSDSRYRER